MNPAANRLKGALLTVASAACISVTFVAGKQAMQELPPLAFIPLWFAAASGWGVGFYLLGNGFTLPRGLKASLRPIGWLGVLNGAHNLLFFIAINLGDPTLAAFFSRSETVFSVLLGTFLLGERMRHYQWAGVAIAVLGTGLMTFRAGTVVWQMLGLLLVSNFFLALSTLVAKKYVITVPPLVLSTARTVVMGGLLALVGLAAGQLSWPGPTTWLWIIGGAFFGPFLSYVLFYKGLLYLDMSKGVIIRSMQPLFVAVYSLMLFGTLVTLRQFAGGALMIVGVVVMLWEGSVAAPRLRPDTRRLSQ